MILATPAGDVMVRGAQLNAMTDLLPLRSRAGVSVTDRTAGGLPAAKEAIRQASAGVAKLDLLVFRGRGKDKRPAPATWQARFFAGTPNERESWFLVWEMTEACLTARHNAYWQKLKDERGQVRAVYVVPPRQVTARWNTDTSRAEYRLTDERGRRSSWLDSSVILHFRVGHPDPGALVAPSPVELHREQLAAALAKSRFESNFYDRGIMQSLAVVFRAEIEPQQARAWREAFEAEHAGLDNQTGVRAFGGGIDKVETVGLSLKDSQYIESMQFSVNEIARMFAWPAALLGAGQPSMSDKPITPEHEEDRLLRHYLNPRLGRIEAHVKADPDFFGHGSPIYPLFDVDGRLRADLKTEAEIEHMQIQDGTLLVDEARARRGLPPLPDGVGQIPQIVPVGGSPAGVPLPAGASRNGAHH